MNIQGKRRVKLKLGIKSLKVYKNSHRQVFYPNSKPYMHHDFILHMISYRTERSHARSRINRIFSRVVFLERKLGVSVFSSLFMWGGTSPVGSDLEWQSQRKNHFKNEFSLCRRLFTSPKIYLVRRSPVLFLAFHY